MFTRILGHESMVFAPQLRRVQLSILVQAADWCSPRVFGQAAGLGGLRDDRSADPGQKALFVWAVESLLTIWT